MMKKIIMLFVALIFSFYVQAQDVFSLKGKNIILKPAHTGNISNHIYNKGVLKKMKFKDSDKYNYSVIGKRVHVADVFYIQYGKKKKDAIGLTLYCANDTVILRLPLYIPYGHKSVYTSMPDNTLARLLSGLTYVLTAENIHIPHYNTEYIDKIESRYKNHILYPMEKPSILDKPYLFNGFLFDESGYNLYGFFSDGDKFEKISYPDNESLHDFQDKYMIQSELIALVDSMYNNKFIQDLKERYIGKEIYLMANLGALNQRHAFNGDYARWVSDNVYYGYTESFGGWLQYDTPIKCICKDIKILQNGYSKKTEYRYYAVIDSQKEGWRGSEFLVPITDKFSSYFLFPNEFEKYEEERLRKLKEESDAISKFEKAYYRAVDANFGKTNGDKIFKGIVAFGFTQEMCKLARGHSPYKISKESTHLGLATKYHFYTERVYYYFIDDKLVGILEYGKKIKWGK